MNIHIYHHFEDEKHSVEVIHRLEQIKETLNIMSEKQDEFDAKIDRANTALDSVATAIEAETAQIAAYIAANPGVDTSALDGVVSRLESVKDSVGTVFEPVTEEE